MLIQVPFPSPGLEQILKILFLGVILWVGDVGIPTGAELHTGDSWVSLSFFLTRFPSPWYAAAVGSATKALTSQVLLRRSWEKRILKRYFLLHIRIFVRAFLE